MAVLVYQFWWPALASLNPERELFGEDGCGEPCVISYNPGGSSIVFMMMAHQFHLQDRLLVIDGKCYSACAIMADFARPHVCVTEQVELGFHKGYRSAGGGRFEPPQSKDVDDWVREHGGYPEEGILSMSFKDVKTFWSVCTAEQRAAL